MLENVRDSVKSFHELIDLGLINMTGEFVPTLMYPPMGQVPPMTEKEFLDGYVPPKDNKFVVYAHIPFCIMQCAFCHFPNVISVSDGEKDVYFDHMEKEMNLYLDRLGIKKLKARTMLFGGGTPTNISPAHMKRFLGFLMPRVDLEPAAQFTCDLDPLTMIGWEGRERMQMLRSAGVNRLALGVQSFSDDILKRMGRHHNSADNIRAIGVAKEMGFKLNIELIYGYPGETPEHWESTVKQALSYGVDEIIVYRLKILPYGAHTGAINSMFDKRGNPLVSNDEQITYKSMARTILEANGYQETTTRTFSRTPEDYSNYHSDLMDQYDVIGFGYYAMSLLHDRFKQNTRDMKEYYSEIDAGRLPVKTGILRTRDQQLRRHAAVPLRNRHVSKKRYQEMTGVAVNSVFGKKIQLLKEHGLLEEDAELLKPTKKGRLFWDEVAQFFFHPDYMPFPKEKYKSGPLNPFLDNKTLS